MPNTFAITIVFIVLSTAVAAFVRRRSKDKCLSDFARHLVMLEDMSGRLTSGKLIVDHTGLEFIYTSKTRDGNVHGESSTILYKSEYSNIQTIIRFHDSLGERDREEREKVLKRTYHPTPLRRLGRKILNFFKTIRDSVIEIVNMLLSQAQKVTPAGAVLGSQGKYVSQMKQELVGSVGVSFEPLLEKYIGHRVILDLIKGDKRYKYPGVLREYTADFIEIMDVDYKVKDDEPARKADLVILRKHAVVRHSGE
jgi:hypothetical protein